MSESEAPREPDASTPPQAATPASEPREATPPATDAPSPAADSNPAATPGDGGSKAPPQGGEMGGEKPGDKPGEKTGEKKRRRRKKPKSRDGAAPRAPGQKAGRPSAEPRSPAELLEVALTALGSAYIDLKRRAGGSRLETAGSNDAVELTLEVPLRRGAAHAAAEALLTRLRDDLEKRVLDAGLVVPGRIWNFATESFDSDWSRPEDPRHVLVGYGLEGRPRWADLVTLAIERKHEAVEQLLAGREGAVSFVERGDAVTEGVQPAFDPASIPFRIVGQLVSGLFESAEAGRRVALTIQVLANKTENNGERLFCHPICAIDMADLPDPSIRKILKNFESRLNELAKQLDGKRAAGETVDVQDEVLPLLRDLARRLSQDAKTRSRKTEHARDRGDEGRPTTLAFPEARSARDHHLYMDNEEQTVVVVGKKGRIHVFSPDGRHVTSVVMPPVNVRQRVKAGRWRLAEPAERGTFREALTRKGASDAEAKDKGDS